MSELDGQVVLITGAAERAGRALATGLANRGARLVVNHLPSQASQAAEVVAAIRRAGSEAVAVSADITDAAQATQLVNGAIDAFGRLDVLIHNASSFTPRPFLDVQPADFDASLGINLRGPFFVSQAAARVMLEQPDGGRILALIGNSLSEAWPDFVPHTIGKTGLARLMEQLAVALSPRVQCNSVAPSQFFTSDDGANDALRQSRGEEVAGGRLFRHTSGTDFREVDLDDVLRVLIDLCVAPRSLTGATIRLDGGRALA
ncbi:MAG: hypothetical protein JWP75_11 [Frondihabitans sp.]|nr:hypothetical protein [Frondihabitans sp.]